MDKIKIDIGIYRTGYLAKKLRVSRATIAKWKKSKEVPIKKANEIISIIKGV